MCAHVLVASVSDADAAARAVAPLYLARARELLPLLTILCDVECRELVWRVEVRAVSRRHVREVYAMGPGSGRSRAAPLARCTCSLQLHPAAPGARVGRWRRTRVSCTRYLTIFDHPIEISLMATSPQGSRRESTQT